MELDEICPEADYHLIVAMSDIARAFKNQAEVFPFLGLIPVEEVRWGRASGVRREEEDSSCCWKSHSCSEQRTGKW